MSLLAPLVSPFRRSRERLPGSGHSHPAALHAPRSLGDHASDIVASALGSWVGIGTMSVFVLFWISLNVAAWVHHWDPYPFILLNLVFSTQAYYSAPIILMSQNRRAELDRVEAQNAYHHVDEVNEKQDRQFQLLEQQTADANRQHTEILKCLSLVYRNQRAIEDTLARLQRTVNDTNATVKDLRHE